MIPSRELNDSNGQAQESARFDSGNPPAMPLQLEYALRYASMGWKVFPLNPGEKTPLGSLVPRGFHQASSDAAQIRRWWTNHPSAGIGVHPTSAGLAVLDVDTKDGAQGPDQLDALQAKHGELPPTLTARTPSGAMHLVFRCEHPLGNHKIAPDIDIRCANGYIAVEPTTLSDLTEYSWLDWDVLDDVEPEVAELPQWVIDLSIEAAEKEKRRTAASAPEPFSPPADMEDVRRRLHGFLAKNRKAGARWEGSKEGLSDTSGSAMDFSMVALLKIGGFDLSEIRALLNDWPHGSNSDQRHTRRYWERIWERTSEPKPESDLPFASDMDLAETFVRQNTNQFRWSPGMDWMCNVGSHWERDATMTRFTLAKKVCKEAAAAINDEKLKRKIASASTVNNVLTLARSEPAIATPVVEWDKEPMLLNTPTGVYDLRTGKQVDRGQLLFTQVAGAAPSSSAIPVWDRFITQVFDNDLEMIEFIQRMGGYCLTGSAREQKLFFLHGVGSNGKSVFLDVLHGISGTYSHNLPSEALMRQQNEGHPTQYAGLFGKRLAVSSEIEENAYWAESRIKSLTGDETLTARYMRQDFFTFNITHKHLIAGNYKPRLKGDDYAMIRRLVLIPFEQQFTGTQKDASLPAKLKAEYPGILAWFIEGATKWHRDGLLIPQRILDASKEYMADNDDLALWLEECCIQGSSYRASSTDLYKSFSEWKKDAGEHPQSQRAFSQRLEKLFAREKTRTGRWFVGLGLREPLSGPHSYSGVRG